MGGKLVGVLVLNCVGGFLNVDELFVGEEEDFMVVVEMWSLDDMGILSIDYNGCVMVLGVFVEIC